jgi:hypothetical protein
MRSLFKVLCSGAGATKMRRIGSNAAVAVAVVITLVACGSNTQSGQGPLRLPSHGSSNSSAGWKDFLASSTTGGWTSGCPSQACTDILAQLQAGVATRTVPPDLTPTLEEASKDTQPGAPRYQLQAPRRSLFGPPPGFRVGSRLPAMRIRCGGTTYGAVDHADR